MKAPQRLPAAPAPRAAAQPAPQAQAEPFAIVALSRPLKAIDQSFTELRLREPTGEDLSEAGYPVRFTAAGTTEFDAPAMTRLIARLAGVPLTSVKAMPARDWNKCALALAAFLGDGAASA